MIAIYLGTLGIYSSKSTCSFVSVKCAYSGFVCKSCSRVSYFVYVQIIAQVHRKHIKLCIYKHTVRQRYGFLWNYLLHYLFSMDKLLNVINTYNFHARLNYCCSYSPYNIVALTLRIWRYTKIRNAIGSTSSISTKSRSCEYFYLI